jgi:hypothetical protein
MDTFVPEKIREGYEVFHSFLDANEEKIKNGEELLLEVTDLESLEKLPVRALVKESHEGDEVWKDLWIRDKEDKITPKIWKIKVVEELDPDEVNVRRPGFGTEESKGPYGSALTTKKMEQDAKLFKKQFGRKQD